ncbi:CCL3 protein, partial [Piaya cayana]|nr:CCL3 protein [Piaya cayana]
VPCCFSYSQVPLPRRIIATAYITSSSCSLPAVVLVTKKNRLVCADPQAAWVQAHLKDFQKN